ncbi:YdcF family protein [Nostoc sp. FACHB-152]|uniref:YdcF family protein n=1 Tax=unclassified Nostoc TaxID=2593658 RepID=UPI001689AA59|nr:MULTISPECIES: YdcF family protein [unclassified Nostoc]MBD2447111.1 YdcF family protein [Nostoc sp. FACHB-152]MBD2469210.1 YdcF family protein [Nostoc sp. FACHB-145]
MPAKKIYRKWLMMIFITAISTLIVVFVTTALNIYWYGNNSSNIKADAAIVLGAAVWGNEPSPVFRERINHGINLYKNANVSKIIFTGGVGESDELAEAIVGKNYAVANGVKAAEILTETRSRTTYQNLKNALEVISGHNLTKFLIVSDPLHMKRSVLMAKHLGMDAYPSPTPTTRYRTFRSQIEFLLRETYFYFVFLVFKI